MTAHHGTLESGTPAIWTGPPNPEGRSVERGVVIAVDIMGLRPLFSDMCQRLSDENGWAVCAVEMFPGEEHLDLAERQNAVGTHTDERVIGDLVAAADSTGAERLAVMGFCMGGMYAFKAAGSGRFDRAVAFYGMIRVPEKWRSPGQGEPLEYLARPEACATLAILGGKDPYTPAEDITALEALPNVETVAYPEADHGFVHDPSRPTHRATDAANAWQRVTSFINS